MTRGSAEGQPILTQMCFITVTEPFHKGRLYMFFNIVSLIRCAHTVIHSNLTKNRNEFAYLLVFFFNCTVGHEIKLPQTKTDGFFFLTNWKTTSFLTRGWITNIRQQMWTFGINSFGTRLFAIRAIGIQPFHDDYTLLFMPKDHYTKCHWSRLISYQTILSQQN